MREILSNDDLATVWDVLAATATPLRPRDLVNEAATPLPTVLAALAALRAARLLDQDDEQGCLARRALDAHAWGRALHIGIPLEILDRHARLRPRAAAWEGQVEAWAADLHQHRSHRRQEWLSGQAAACAAATDLAHVLEDVRTALATVPPPSRRILQAALAEGEAILETVRRQAERGL